MGFRESLAGHRRQERVTLRRLGQFKGRVLLSDESSVVYEAMDKVMEDIRSQVMAQTVTDLVKEAVELDDVSDLDIRS